MQLISVNVGLPAWRVHNTKRVLTGGDKLPVDAAQLEPLGFVGDGQADRVNHGGADKAVCVFPYDHYAHWSEVLGRTLTPGAFSENLTVAGALEDVLCIGDLLRIGSAVVQVAQPRMPCAKLAAKLGNAHAVKWLADANHTGCYLSVVEPGTVARDDTVEVIEAHPDRISITAVNDILYDRSADVTLIAHLAELPAFGESGRIMFRQRLARLQGSGQQGSGQQGSGQQGSGK
jgi:MOSC domain-containing protein YiiM